MLWSVPIWTLSAGTEAFARRQSLACWKSLCASPNIVISYQTDLCYTQIHKIVISQRKKYGYEEINEWSFTPLTASFTPAVGQTSSPPISFCPPSLTQLIWLYCHSRAVTNHHHFLQALVTRSFTQYWCVCTLERSIFEVTLSNSTALVDEIYHYDIYLCGKFTTIQFASRAFVA